MKTCIGCKHNIGNLNDVLTTRKHYEPDGKTCVGCAFNKVGVVYMSRVAYDLNGPLCPCYFCYPWDDVNSKHTEYVPATAPKGGDSNWKGDRSSRMD